MNEQHDRDRDSARDHDMATMLADSLRHRAVNATPSSRGFSDVRRRVRRHRQRQLAIGLLPAVAGVGWFATRPIASDPLRPAAGDTATLPLCEGPSGPTTSILAYPTVDTGPTDDTGSTPTTAGPDVELYTVREGDSWFAIATQFGTTIDSLMFLNGVSADQQPMLFPGDTIIVPRSGITTTSITETTVVAAVFHVVAAGESWNWIAEHFGPDVSALMEANGATGADPNAPLTAGITVMIPVRDLSTWTVPEPGEATTTVACTWDVENSPTTSPWPSTSTGLSTDTSTFTPGSVSGSGGGPNQTSTTSMG